MTDIKIIEGNIFAQHVDALANPVNCVGVMGAGLAKQMKQRFPDMYREYRQLCEDGSLLMGSYSVHIGQYPAIINIPTKYHWKNQASLEMIRESLESMTSPHNHEFSFLGIRSVAFPLLGCGLGGLKEEDVLPIMVELLKNSFEQVVIVKYRGK